MRKSKSFDIEEASLQMNSPDRRQRNEGSKSRGNASMNRR